VSGTTPADVWDGRIAPLDTCTLDDLGDAALIDRVDRKFTLARDAAPAWLASCTADYLVLEVCGQRRTTYVTTYYDTPALHAYRAHVARRPTRCKVRTRAYANTGATWLEVKQRVANGRTVKARVPWHATAADDDAVGEALAHAPFATLAGGWRTLDRHTLRAVLTVTYERTTLVRRDRAERVTIDANLRWALAPGLLAPADDGCAATTVVDQQLIVECKQALHGHSPAIAALRVAHARHEAISKYCVGVAALIPAAPAGGFHAMLRRLREMSRAA
jgi:hypothetical protein